MDVNIENKINAMLEKIAQGYARAKADWTADKRNPFKDGRFLAYYDAMKCLNVDDSLGSAAEEIKRRFNVAKQDWSADKRNPFKDGKMLGYFEVLSQLPAAA